jgi:hypothetical protein
VGNSPFFKRQVPLNHADQRPSMFVFLHCESTRERVNHVKPFVRHKLHTGVACAVEWRRNRGMREKWFTFVHNDVFWSWLPEWQKHNRTVWVVMHNAYRTLTLLDLWGLIEDGHYPSWRAGRKYRDPKTRAIKQSEPWRGLKAIDGRPFHLETEGPRGRVNFTDVKNFYPMSLEELRGSMEFPVGLNDAMKEYDELKEIQCTHCTEIIKETYLRLVERWEREKNGNWQFSNGGLAWSNYRHKFMEEKIMLHQHPQAMALEEACYIGGETRCWFRGRVDRPLIEYDVNSMYPYVMLNNVYPTALIDYYEGDCYDKMRAYIGKYCTVADVTLDCDVDHYPLRRGGCTLFPVGAFRTVLCGPELLSAVERCHVKKVHSLAIYTCGNIFTYYVLHWWEEKARCKRKGDQAGELFAKLMLNSLPAKFAQKTPQWVDNNLIDVVRPWSYFQWKAPGSTTVYPARSVGWQGQFCLERKPTENAFPLIFAYVTAYAREYMRELRKSIPRHLLYYQDTDSLILSDCSIECIADSNWRVGTGIGQLREKGRYSSATFRGPKNYTVDDKLVISGVKADDIHHSDTEHTGLREERASSLFRRPHHGEHRELITDLILPGCNYHQQYDSEGWALPIKLP